MKFIRYEDVPVGLLLSNPKNPRADLGDLTELAENIATNGIYQELTVIPHGQNRTEDGYKDAYMVVIGHRRLAAAKQAGLKTVPCKIVEMSSKEMQTTMLAENVQRSDLTPLEEAKGIQMCLDLGIPESEITKQAGMSKKVIKTRKILLQYDQDMAKNAFSSGATLQEFIDAENIKDPDIREKLIREHAGTNNFRMEYEKALKKQERKEWEDRMIEILAEKRIFPAPKEISQEDLKYGSWISFYDSMEDIKSKIFRAKSRSNHHDDKFFYFVESYGINIKIKPVNGISAERSTADLEREKREDAVKELKEACDNARMCRIRFMKDLSAYLPKDQHAARKESLLYLIEAICERWTINEYSLSKDIYRELISKKGKFSTQDLIQKIGDLYDSRPVYALLLIEYIARESRISDSFADYRGMYSPYAAKTAKELYEWLEKYNYRISDDEKQLINGTHPAYTKEADNAEQTS